MRLTAAFRLCALGCVMLVALTICAHKFSNLGEPSFLIWLAVAGVAYLLAIRELFFTQSFPMRLIVFAIVLAAIWHFLLLLKQPGIDDDIHRYVWDGRVQRLGYNPYILIPADPAVASLHTSQTRTLNHPDLASPYPPGAQLFFHAVTTIHESVFAMKAAFVLCEWAIALVMLDLLRRSGQATHWVLAYLWNPLLAIEVAGSGHIDIVGALLLVVSLAALGRRWRAVAAVAFGLAVSVKFLPIVLVPLYWRRLRVRDALLAAVVFAAPYLPFVQKGRIPIGSVAAYVHSFRFNDPIFTLLERMMAPEIAAGMAALAGFLLAIWLRGRSEDFSADSCAWPMAATLLCAPVVYPWYLLWLTPFMRPVSTVPIMVWTVSIIPTYYVWYQRSLGRPWILPGWIMLLEYGSVAAAVAVIALRRPARPSLSREAAQQN